MVILLDYFNFLKRRHYDHDAIDNINTRYICIFAFTVGFLLFASEYGVNSIQCFPKASWKNGWKQYAEDLCFIEGSYFVDPNSNLPHYSDLPNYQKVLFYQWVPFIYFLIALIFHLPRVFWSWISSPSYLFFKEICESAREYRSRHHTKSLLRFADESMRNPALLPSHFGIEYINRFFDEQIGNRYLIISYFVVKIWNILNVVIAHLLLCLIIAQCSHDPLGYKTFQQIVTGVNWRESGAFPRITTCDIATRQYAGEIGDRIKHEQTQCLLHANLYIEKIFLLNWIIFVILFVVNIFNLFQWIWKIWHSKHYVKECIKAMLEHRYNEASVSNYANLLLPDARFTILMATTGNGDHFSGSDFTLCFILWEETNKSKSS